MDLNQFDADEARAHIILLRDGLEKIDVIFERTKFIPNKYIKKYGIITSVEDVSQIAYMAHTLAIQTFPINSTVNFFGWAGHTIRREIVDFVRKQKRYKVAAERLKKVGVDLLGTCEHPEQEYLSSEFARVLDTALNSIGAKNKKAIIEQFLDEDCVYNTESYFKRRKRISGSLSRLSAYTPLRDYL
jgi:RNA polymerase sigma factor (sigma-70 family)